MSSRSRGVIEYWYDGIFQSSIEYKNIPKRKEWAETKLKSVGVKNRYRIHFIIRPNISLKQSIEIDLENKKANY
jgi:hypothetical protein